MTQKREGTLQLVDKKMQQYSGGGRNATEYSILRGLIRPRVMKAANDEKGEPD